MQYFPQFYEFNNIEKKWQNLWLNSNLYSWDSASKKENSFSIDTPPPTVSGELHIGHVYSYLQTDFIVRFWRMRGKNICYPMGFDDNGLPTERLVEKKKNIKAYQLDRQEFINICKEVIEVEEEKFKELFNDIALSVDWNLLYQTVSPESQKISQMSFLDLLQKGEIYRASQPMLWDSVDGTALAQADIEDKEKPSVMNEITFTTTQGEKIFIATTRPELLPACVCVLYHPEDIRYQHLKGECAVTPLFNVKVPIIADELVLQEKGTGLVMCCTFGDQTDIIWWRKHKLPTRIILDKQGKLGKLDFSDSLNKSQAEAFSSKIEGLKAFAARSQIIELLKEENLLVKQTENLSFVKCAERSGAPLEILMHDQWFIHTLKHKEALLKRAEELNWHPPSMKIKLENWINGLSWDWCISRSRFFGVPFPVWYSKREGEEGRILTPNIDALPVDPLKDLPEGYSKDEVEPDLDVMDTWATSSVSPQLTSHAISDEFHINLDRHNQLFPFDLRPQAHEIIRTWAFYTILKSHLHQNSLPWKNIMISGWCLAEDKTKMSKSKGNVITPHQLLKEDGADVIRYWAASSKLGADTAFSEDIIKAGKRLVTKLWNVAKFASSHFASILEEDKKLFAAKDKIYCQIDLWLLNELKNLVNNVTIDMENYEYANAINDIEKFLFATYSDDYLEIVKVRCYHYNKNGAKASYSAILTIYYSLNVILRLFAPFLPHIAEEIYQILYPADNFCSINGQNQWPLFDELALDYKNEKVENLLAILNQVRKIKAERKISVKAPIKILEIINAALDDDLVIDLKNVVSADTISLVQNSSSNFKDFDQSAHKIHNFYIKCIF